MYYVNNDLFYIDFLLSRMCTHVKTLGYIYEHYIVNFVWKPLCKKNSWAFIFIKVASINYLQWIVIDKARKRVSIFTIFNESHLSALEHLFWTSLKWKAQWNWIKYPRAKQRNPFYYVQQRDPMSVMMKHILYIMVLSFKMVSTCPITNAKKGSHSSMKAWHLPFRIDFEL